MFAIRPNQTLAHLPVPDQLAVSSSQQLQVKIIEKIQTQGPISFADFMQMCLYAPGLGYYVNGSQKFGASGDFVTAPEISNLFAKCLARQIAQVFMLMEKPNILEFGAGSGVLALDLLLALAAMQQLPENYLILETSPVLKAQQQALIASRAPAFLSRVKWLDDFPQSFSGVVIANEVLDAMPVNRFVYDHGFKEICVDLDGEKFVWRIDEIKDSNFFTALEALPALPSGYVSEINLQAKPWLAALEVSLQQGLVLLIDYGFPASEYYHPSRAQGTLMCHYRQHAHQDVFYYPGLQDITAHVDFSLLAQVSPLKINGFTSQGQFLLNCGLLDLFSAITGEIEKFNASRQIQQLIMPHEMGEIFKVMALSRRLDCDLLGFVEGNKLSSLL